MEWLELDLPLLHKAALSFMDLYRVKLRQELRLILTTADEVEKQLIIDYTCVLKIPLGKNKGVPKSKF